jgi:hypothetical protein
MNKAVTDGIDFLPPPFIDGLSVWSRGDGTPGSPSYANAPGAAFVADDPDFRGCLQLTKTEATQRLRFTGRTPILPGCYVRVRVRLKVLSGALPGVRIAAWAGRANGSHLDGVAEHGPTRQIDRHDKVVTVEGYCGTGARAGVDMPWGTAAAYGHFGIDLLGDTGAVIRIDDVEIADGTDAFLRDMMDIVDIRDFGAMGDGYTDDTAALEAADAAADGRVVLVPEGTYWIARSVSIASPIRFHGRLTMPDSAMLLLMKGFDLPTYIEAFGNEATALKKALQALFNHTDHDSLDMGGRRIQVQAPIDVAAAVDNKSSFNTRRVLRNGQIEAEPAAGWTPVTFVTQARYSASDPTHLTDVSAAAAVLVGAHVAGPGVGREVYVRSVDAAAGRVRLSAPLFGAEGVRSFTFTRFRYLLDFSGFASLAQFIVEGVELLCNGEASGILLAPEGQSFQFRDGQIDRPRDRGITSIGRGCQDLMLDRNQFRSNEHNLRAQDRTTVLLNANANDLKLRDNRVVRFRHFAVLGGSGNLLVGNHWFQGDDFDNGVRTAGVLFTTPNLKSAVTGNYIDNSMIEWTNEHDATPDLGSEYSFGGLTITGNFFTVARTTDAFRWLVIKPFGSGHFLHGLTMTGNVFRTVSTSVRRIEAVDTTHAALDAERARNVVIDANTFNGIDEPVWNPARARFSVGSPQAVWTLDAGPLLAFGGVARAVTGLVPDGTIRNAANQSVHAMPQIETRQGADRRSIALHWPEPVKGSVRVTLRIDSPD